MQQYRFLKIVVNDETYVVEQDDAAIDIPAKVSRVYRVEKAAGMVSQQDVLEGEDRLRILDLATKGWRV